MLHAHVSYVRTRIAYITTVQAKQCLLPVLSLLISTLDRKSYRSALICPSARTLWSALASHKHEAFWWPSLRNLNGRQLHILCFYCHPFAPLTRSSDLSSYYEDPQIPLLLLLLLLLHFHHFSCINRYSPNSATLEFSFSNDASSFYCWQSATSGFASTYIFSMRIMHLCSLCWHSSYRTSSVNPNNNYSCSSNSSIK